MTRHACAELSIAFLMCLASTSTSARNEQLAITQTSDQSIIVTLSGSIFYCQLLGGFEGQPRSSVIPPDVEIVSNIYLGECQPPYPGFVTPLPVPYSIPINLGVLPNGRYSVTWSFTVLGSPQLVNLGSFQTSFVLQAGLLRVVPVSVPTLSPIAYVGLILLLAAYLRLGRRGQLSVR